MIRKYHNHKLRTNQWHREEEPHNNDQTPERQTKQSSHGEFVISFCYYLAKTIFKNFYLSIIDTQIKVFKNIFFAYAKRKELPTYPTLKPSRRKLHTIFFSKHGLTYALTMLYIYGLRIRYFFIIAH